MLFNGVFIFGDFGPPIMEDVGDCFWNLNCFSLEHIKVSKASLTKFLSSLGIVNYVLEGNSLKAIELIEQLSQDILKNNKDLMLDLLSLHFVVLVCSQKWWDEINFSSKWACCNVLAIIESCVSRAEAVEFAQANMSSYASHSIYSERVEVCLPFANYSLIHVCVFKVN